MKRVLVLAALALGAGCSSPPPPPLVNLNLYWHFVGAQGQVYGNGSQTDPGCAQAGVDTVQVRLTDPTGYLTVQTFPCVQSNGVPGVTFPGMIAGPYSWVLDGYRGSLPVYDVTQASQNVAPDSTGNAVFDVGSQALYPDLIVSYFLPSGPPQVTCSTAGIKQMSFALFQGSSLVYTNGGSPGFAVPCGDPTQNNNFTVPSLPFGNYQLRYLAALDSTGNSLFEVCGQLVSQGSTTQNVDVNLAPAGAACP